MRTCFVLCLSALLLGQVAINSARAANDPATEQARQHYQKAQKAYDLGRWDDAIAEYEAAYSLRSDPTFLYNMAQAYRRKGDAQRALDLFKNYLVKVPDSPQRPDIEERIRALKKQLEQAEQAAKRPSEGASNGTPAVGTTPPAAPLPAAPAANTAPATGAPATPAEAAVTPSVSVPTVAVIPVGSQPAPPVTVTALSTPAPTQENRSLRVTGLVVGGFGLAAVVGGVVMGARAKSLSDEVSSDAKKQPAGTFDQSTYDSGKTAETLQWVGYGVGAVALVGGSILYWLGMPRSAESAPTQTSITVLPYASVNSAGGHLFVAF